MAITTFAGIYSGPMQEFSFAKILTTGSTADNPTLTWLWSGRPNDGAIGLSLSGTSRSNSSSGAIPFTNPSSGQNTYLSRFDHASSDFSGKSVFIIDLLWITSAVSQVTTTQTINSISLPARDIDGATDGRGVYIAMFHSTGYASSNSYTATITYTNSSGTGSKTGTVSRTGGASNRWVPFGLASGDEGVRSVQDFTFSAVPGTSGVTVLIAYRPIAILSSEYTLGCVPISDTALTLGMPRIYDNSCLTIINMAGSNQSWGTYTFSQG